MILVIPEALLLVEQICPTASQVDNLRAAVSVFFQPGAFEAVEGVRDALAAADDTFVLVISKAAFIADAHERGRPDVTITDGAFAVALVAETTDSDAWLLAAHDKVWVVARHVLR